MNIKIEKGIPLPKRRKWGDIAKELRKMNVGDSFVVEIEQRGSINTAFRRLGFCCATEKIDDKTARVWRVK